MNLYNTVTPFFIFLTLHHDLHLYQFNENVTILTHRCTDHALWPTLDGQECLLFISRKDIQQDFFHPLMQEVIHLNVSLSLNPFHTFTKSHRSSQG